MAIEQLPAMYTDALCAAQRSCLDWLQDAFLRGQDCKAAVGPAADDAFKRINKAVSDNKVIYNSAKAQACLDALKKQGCSDNVEPLECKAVFTGKVEDGGNCEIGAECAGADSYCKSSGACPGVCTPREPEGAACRVDGDCADGLTCSGSTKSCVKPAANGQACGGGNAPDCAEGSICYGDDDESGKTGTCAGLKDSATAQEGESCFVGVEKLCAQGLVCTVSVEGQSFKGACSKPVASGAACSGGLPDPCPDAEYCAGATPQNGFNGQCTPRPGEGQSCASALGDSVCAVGLACDGGKCRPRQGLGGSCAGDGVCLSGRCESGVCVPSDGCR